jgi:hypothetical protein
MADDTGHHRVGFVSGSAYMTDSAGLTISGTLSTSGSAIEE